MFGQAYADKSKLEWLEFDLKNINNTFTEKGIQYGKDDLSPILIEDGTIYFQERDLSNLSKLKSYIELAEQGRSFMDDRIIPDDIDKSLEWSIRLLNVISEYEKSMDKPTYLALLRGFKTILQSCIERKIISVERSKKIKNLVDRILKQVDKELYEVKNKISYVDGF